MTTPLDKLRDWLIHKHGSSPLAWTRTTELIDDCFKSDATAWKAAHKEIIKAVKKAHTIRPMPKRWLADAEAYGHLTPLTNRIYRDALVAPDAPSADALRDADLSAINHVELRGVELDRDAFAALWANPTLTGVKTLKLERTGMCDAWLPALLDSDALWTSLRALYMFEPKIKGEGAALLASSPRMAQIATLSLRGCPIGPAGRRALGESAHLSDKNKSRTKAKVAIANEAAQEAAPSTRDAFGDARSHLQRVDEIGWERLCDLLDRLDHSPDQERVTQELLPYVSASLERWPDALKLAPVAWIDALMEGKPAPQAIQLARGLRLEALTVNAERVERLVKSAQLGPIRHLHARGVTLSAKALRALWPACAELETLELRCNDQGDALAEALRDEQAPGALRELSIRQSASPTTLTAAIERQPHLKRLRLSGSLRSAAGYGGPRVEEWSALLNSPALLQLDALSLGHGALDHALLLALPQAPSPAQLTHLLLADAPFNAQLDAAYSRWVAGCERLRSLTLGRGCAPRMAQLMGDLPAGLTDLSLDVGGEVVEAALLRGFVRDRGAALERLRIDSTASTWLAQPTDTLSRALFQAAAIEAPRLRSLSCELTATVRTAAQALDQLLPADALPQLEHLGLTQRLDGEEIARLIARLKLPALRSLTLPQLTATPPILDALIDAPCWPQLTALALPSLTITSAALGRLLTQLPPRLTTLQLTHTPLHEVSLQLAHLPPTIERLDLTAHQLTAQHLPDLLALIERLPALIELDLSMSGLSDEAVVALVSSPAIAKLHRLKLHHISLKFPAQQAIARSPHLHLEAKTHVLQ